MRESARVPEGTETTRAQAPATRGDAWPPEVTPAIGTSPDKTSKKARSPRPDADDHAMQTDNADFSAEPGPFLAAFDEADEEWPPEVTHNHLDSSGLTPPEERADAQMTEDIAELRARAAAEAAATATSNQQPSPSGVTDAANAWGMSPPNFSPPAGMPAARETQAGVYSSHDMSANAFDKLPRPENSNPERWSEMADEEQQEEEIQQEIDQGAKEQSYMDMAAARKAADRATASTKFTDPGSRIIAARYTDITEPGCNNYFENAAVVRAAADELALGKVEMPKSYLMALPVLATRNRDGSVRDWKLMLTKEAKEYMELEGFINVTNREGTRKRLQIVPSDDTGEPIPENAAAPAAKTEREAEAKRQTANFARKAKAKADEARMEKQARTVKLSYDFNDFFFQQAMKPGGLKSGIEGIEHQIKSVASQYYGPVATELDVTVHQGYNDELYPDSRFLAYIVFPKSCRQLATDMPWKRLKTVFPGTPQEMTAFMPGPILERMGIAKCCFYEIGECRKTAGRGCPNMRKNFPSSQGGGSRKRDRDEKAWENERDRQTAAQREIIDKFCPDYREGRVRRSPKTTSHDPHNKRAAMALHATPNDHTTHIAVPNRGLPDGARARKTQIDRVLPAVHPMPFNAGRNLQPARLPVPKPRRHPDAIGARRETPAAQCQTRGGGRHGTGMENGKGTRSGNGFGNGKQACTANGKGNSVCVQCLRILCFLVGRVEKQERDHTGGRMCQQKMLATLRQIEICEQTDAAHMGDCGFDPQASGTTCVNQTQMGNDPGGRAENPVALKRNRYDRSTINDIKKQRIRTVTEIGCPRTTTPKQTATDRSWPAYTCPD